MPHRIFGLSNVIQKLTQMPAGLYQKYGRFFMN